MSVLKFCLVLDKPDKIYYPGEKVTGRVELVLISELKLTAVKLKIKGKAECKWKTRIYGHTIRNRKSTEIYIKNEQIIIEGRERGGKFILPKAEYIYPFDVILPLNAPSSFVGSYGKISYYGKATIQVSSYVKVTKRAEFTVINPLNLNLFPDLWTPYKIEANEPYCSCFIRSGLISMIVYLPKTGFATTESIPIALKVINASNRNVNYVQVCLKRVIRWTAEGHDKKSNLNFKKLKSDAMESFQSKTMKVDFTIPPISFPNLAGCSIIEMNHELQITAVVSDTFFNLEINVPIEIGDIALSKDSNTTIVPSQNQTLSNNMDHPNHTTFPNSGNSVDADEYPHQWFGLGVPPPSALLDVAPQLGMNNAPKLGFVEPKNPHLSAEEIPQMPTQEISLPVQQYPSQTLPALPSSPPQPATNFECSQNSSRALVDDVDANYGRAFCSFKSDVQLEKTSFLSDSKGQNATSILSFLSEPPPS